MSYAEKQLFLHFLNNINNLGGVVAVAVTIEKMELRKQRSGLRSRNPQILIEPLRVGSWIRM